MAQIDLTYLREYLWREYGIRRDLVVPNARLIYDLGLTSLDTVNLMIEVEEKLDVAITDEEAGSLKTVKDLLTLLRERNDGTERWAGPDDN